MSAFVKRHSKACTTIGAVALVVDALGSLFVNVTGVLSNPVVFDLSVSSIGIVGAGAIWLVIVAGP